MKTYRERKEEEKRKVSRRIWSFLKIEKAIAKFGFPATKSAVTRWLKFQQQNAKLLKEKRILESKLAEVEAKL